MVLKWRVKDLDFIQTPAEYIDVLFDANRKLRSSLVVAGIGSHPHAKLDFIFRGFNMDDPIVGGFERGKLVRQAISLAFDTEEMSDAFYNGTVVRYDGPIPPGLEGHPPGVISPFRGPNIERAKGLLVKAGYPEGKGLPPLQYHSNRGQNSSEQAEMAQRQLRKIGVELEVSLHSFPELDDLMKRKKAQMFSLSWGSDYPDAENNLALFYGPNKSPGANGFNYENPEYDALYEHARTMKPSPERTALYVKMRDIVIEDCPAIGSMARTRYYVWNPRVKNFKPDETWHSWLKYVDVDVRDVDR
jgi:ABC-type transport system substrate-binding protein